MSNSNPTTTLWQHIKNNKLVVMSAGVMLYFWFIKPTDIDIQCLGCVTVPAPNVQQAYVANPTTNVPTEEKSTPVDPKEPITFIEHGKLCEGELKLPKAPRQPPTIPDAVKANPNSYTLALEHQIQSQQAIVKEYQAIVEEAIKRYNLTCK